MKTMYNRQSTGMAVALALVLLLEPIPRAMGQQVAESSSPANVTNGKPEFATVPLPDSPGAVQSALVGQQRPEQEPNFSRSSDQQTDTPRSTNAVNAAPVAGAESSGRVSNAPDTVEPPASNSVASQSPQRPHEPVGTAAAQSVAVTGVAASRPAGAAVAPAKQRRMRSILIKVGAVVGVGVAVGTTMALSQGSPSRPPGSR